ncbi:hypothetical protein AWW71_29470 [Bacillus cereus]|nr:hypothetical protein AWW71_29470 [Bacillus cereus]
MAAGDLVEGAAVPRRERGDEGLDRDLAALERRLEGTDEEIVRDEPAPSLRRRHREGATEPGDDDRQHTRGHGMDDRAHETPEHTLCRSMTENN